MKKITVAAPGKVILHGEHAVVYGKKAIAASINAHVKVCLQVDEPEKNVISLCLPGVVDIQKYPSFTVDIDKLKDFWKKSQKKYGSFHKKTVEFQKDVKDFVKKLVRRLDNKFLAPAVSVCVYAYIKIVIGDGGLDFPPITITANNYNLPIGSGLGSSAAFNVAIATSFLIYAGVVTPEPPDAKSLLRGNVYSLAKPSLAVINEHAYNMEKIVHGEPSGVDNSASTYGGAITFENGKIAQLPGFPELNVLIAETGVQRNTKELVESVKKKSELHPAMMEHIMHAIHAISCRVETLLTKLIGVHNVHNDEHEKVYTILKDMINTNHHLLNAVGVGHEKLDLLHRLASESGFACKMTGAGGGGCALIVLRRTTTHEQLEKLESALLENDIRHYHLLLGCRGVAVLDIQNGL